MREELLIGPHSCIRTLSNLLAVGASSAKAPFKSITLEKTGD